MSRRFDLGIERSAIEANQAQYFRDGSLAGLQAAYSLANLLTELAAFGDSGPPHFYRELRNACAAAVALPVGEL